MPTKTSTRYVGGWIAAGLAIAVLAPAQLRGDEPGKVVGWIDNNDPNRTIHRGPVPNENEHRGEGNLYHPQQQQQQANPQQNQQPQVDPEEQKRKQAAEDNQAGQEALDSEDWATAIDQFESALALNPDNQLYQQNLAYARRKLEEAQADARRKEQASEENHEGVEAFSRRDWATALRNFQQASARWPDNPVYIRNLQNAQKQLDRVQRDASAANDMAALIGQMVDTLPSLSGGGPDFDHGSANPGVNSPGLNISDADGLRDGPNDPSKGNNASSLKISDADNVVDARNVPSGLPKNVDDAIPHGPVGDRVRKGFECVMEHDWPAAKAWFEDALHQDPTDAGVARLIDLAKWTMQREKATTLTFVDADAVMSQMFREGAPISKSAAADAELDEIMDEMFRKMLTDDPKMAAILAKPTGAAAEVEDPAWQKILELLAAGAKENSGTGDGKGAGN